MQDIERARNTLSAAVAQLAVAHRARLDELKAKGVSDRQRHDFVWDSLIQSFATQGSSRGWAGLVDNAERYDALRFESLEGYAADERAERVERVFRAAKVRMPAKKAKCPESTPDLVGRRACAM